MLEELIFNELILKDPNPGIGNRLKSKRGVYFLPSWVFKNEKDFKEKIRANNGSLLISGKNIPLQIIYDILHLGLKSIKDRPRCKVCGKFVRFINGYKGYKKLCDDPVCKVNFGKTIAIESWNNKEYRIKQTEKHKAWAKLPENIEYLKTKMLNLWKDEDYRELQSRSHKLFVKNNPDKVFSGSGGIIESIKSSGGLIRFDSNWEKDIITFCNSSDEIIQIDRSRISIPYTYLNEEFVYIPDFIISTKNNKYLVEVKSDFLMKSDPRTKYKIKAGYDYVENNKNIFKKYIVLFSTDIYVDNTLKIINESSIKTLLEIN